MKTTEFRQQAEAAGLKVRKRNGLEVFDVIESGTELFSVTYAELYDFADIDEVLARKLRREYIPPLG